MNQFTDTRVMIISIEAISYIAEVAKDIMQTTTKPMICKLKCTTKFRSQNVQSPMEL